jgi:hypothetical protein
MAVKADKTEVRKEGKINSFGRVVQQTLLHSSAKKLKKKV